MKQEWRELTQWTQGDEMVVERVRLVKRQIAIEGSFELPAMARLPEEDQMFVTAFVRCHGSIKEMEKLFGISYPTVKNRLNRIACRLDYVEVNPPSGTSDVLDRLARGEISVGDAEKEIRRSHGSAVV